MTGVATINTTADEVGTPFFIRLLNMGMVAQSQTGKQKPHTKANNIPNNAFLGNQRCITFSDKNTWIKDDNKTPMNKKGIACNRMPKKILITVLVDMFHNGKKCWLKHKEYRLLLFRIRKVKIKVVFLYLLI